MLLSNPAAKKTLLTKRQSEPSSSQLQSINIQNLHTEGRMNPLPRLRGKPEKLRPWCWQEKKVRRLIRNRMDGSPFCAYVLGIYDALTEIASDEQTPSFKTLHSHIASKAGCSVSAVKRALSELVDLDVVSIETPPLKGPCTYHLLVAKEPTIAPIEPTLDPTLKRGLGATVEESQKNMVKNYKNPITPTSKKNCEEGANCPLAGSNHQNTLSKLGPRQYVSPSQDLTNVRFMLGRTKTPTAKELDLTLNFFNKLTAEDREQLTDTERTRIEHLAAAHRLERTS